MRKYQIQPLCTRESIRKKIPSHIESQVRFLQINQRFFCSLVSAFTCVSVFMATCTFLIKNGRQEGREEEKKERKCFPKFFSYSCLITQYISYLQRSHIKASVEIRYSQLEIFSHLHLLHPPTQIKQPSWLLFMNRC